jgi:hypothetical protein
MAAGRKMAKGFPRFSKIEDGDVDWLNKRDTQLEDLEVTKQSLSLNTSHLIHVSEILTFAVD